MTLEEINKKIEELELKKNEIISEEKERLENEKKARKQKVDEAYDAFIKQSYDNTDLKYFIAGMNNGIPERYKNFKIAVQNESINFVKFIKDHYVKRCIDRKIDKYINYKYWGSLSSLDKYLLNVVKNCNTYIEESVNHEGTSYIYIRKNRENKNEWIIGNSFILKYVSTFDYDKNRIILYSHNKFEIMTESKNKVNYINVVTIILSIIGIILNCSFIIY